MSDHEHTGTPGSDLAALVITSQNPGAWPDRFIAQPWLTFPQFVYPWSAGPILTRRAHGRPRKYDTPEEQAAAHALSQQRYYERNRDSLCRRGHRRYADRSDNQERSRRNVIPHQPRRPRSQGATTVAPQRKATTSEDWKNSLDKIRRKLAIQLAHQTSSSFAAKTYTHAVDSNTADAAATISEALEPFNKLQSRADFIATHIYRKMGCTDLWRDATVVTGQVKEVVDLLQDLLCSALLGVDELKKAYLDGTLLYLEK
ncbi:uncharacterized protein ARMOST_10366 [Armillaria ostoyae]|uniref:Uncharacterized protein n=1 Tax=Armillaria ostoyae TaxID=47428 RepID=A0A284RE36_ARMOS|nr:uncharacterized protein ARMOST_10366 [Armillaria ostoyae]